jgi:hypothetical protein
MMSLMEGTTVRILVNGHATERIAVDRGSRQGCASSPKHFLVIMEPAHRKISQDKESRGVQLTKTLEIKMMLFADDINLIARSLKDFRRMVRLLRHFGEATGLHVARDKCYTVPLGWDPPPEEDAPFTWVRQEPQRYLGIWFNQHGIFPMLPQKITEATDALERWRHLHLSLFGRVTVVNTYMLPTLTFVSLVEHVTQSAVSAIHKAIRAFLWAPTKPINRPKVGSLIGLATAAAPIPNGGLGLRHPSWTMTAQKATLLQRALDNHQLPWSRSFRAQIGQLPYTKKHGLNPSVWPRKPKSTTIRNPLLRDCIMAYAEVKKAAGAVGSTQSDTYAALATARVMPVTKGRQLWMDSLGENSSIFQWIAEARLRGKLKEFLWKLMNRALPLQPWDPLHCRTWGRMEDHMHAIWDCEAADWAQQFISEILHDAGVSPPEPHVPLSQQQPFAAHVLAIIWWTLWRDRNQRHHEFKNLAREQIQFILNKEIKTALSITKQKHQARRGTPPLRAYFLSIAIWQRVPFASVGAGTTATPQSALHLWLQCPTQR